jgi:hypothetical protein
MRTVGLEIKQPEVKPDPGKETKPPKKKEKAGDA